MRSVRRRHGVRRRRRQALGLAERRLPRSERVRLQGGMAQPDKSIHRERWKGKGGRGMRKKIFAADLFCGAGGTSQGLLMAANELRADLELIAINHWNVAIDTHSVNHPYAKHLCTGLDEIGDPRKLVPGGRLNLLCGSPECTHHSVARGGKPMSDQSRSSAWHILRFAEALYIDNLLIENVPEFLSWGPLGVNGRPLKSKRGQLFEQFIASLRALGYSVEWRVLNCADYGDPTTRRRLFIIARRGNKAIRWPDPTHVPATQLSQDG